MAPKSILELVAGQTVVALPPEAIVWEAANSMKAHDIGAVLVVEDKQLVGIFTERDMVRLMVDADFDLATATLDQVMTPDPDFASPETSVSDALWSMDRGGYRHLPVLDGDGTILGVISRRDFF